MGSLSASLYLFLPTAQGPLCVRKMIIEFSGIGLCVLQSRDANRSISDAWDVSPGRVHVAYEKTLKIREF